MRDAIFMPSIYLGLQTDGEFFIRSSMFAYEERKVDNYYPNQMQTMSKNSLVTPYNYKLQGIL